MSFYGRGVAQPGLAHLHGAQEAAGSNPAAPTRLDFLPPKKSQNLTWSQLLNAVRAYFEKSLTET